MASLNRSPSRLLLLLGAAVVVGVAVSRESADKPERVERPAAPLAVESDSVTVTDTPSAGTPSRPRPEIDWGGTYHTVEGAPACVNRERFDEFRSYYSARDNGALQQIIQSGDCILLKPGLRVTPVDHIGGGMFGQSYVRARVFGTRTTMVLIPELAFRELQDR